MLSNPISMRFNGRSYFQTYPFSDRNRNQEKWSVVGGHWLWKYSYNTLEFKKVWKSNHFITSSQHRKSNSVERSNFVLPQLNLLKCSNEWVENSHKHENLIWFWWSCSNGKSIIWIEEVHYRSIVRHHRSLIWRGFIFKG